ncbi:hypothetical protein GCM10022420_083270 [Streptomyces iranensis]
MEDALLTAVAVRGQAGALTVDQDPVSMPGMVRAGSHSDNDQPDAEEAAEVADFFAAHDVGDPVPGWGTPSEG